MEIINKTKNKITIDGYNIEIFDMQDQKISQFSDNLKGTESINNNVLNSNYADIYNKNVYIDTDKIL